MLNADRQMVNESLDMETCGLPYEGSKQYRYGRKEASEEDIDRLVTHCENVLKPAMQNRADFTDTSDVQCLTCVCKGLLNIVKNGRCPVAEALSGPWDEVVKRLTTYKNCPLTNSPVCETRDYVPYDTSFGGNCGYRRTYWDMNNEQFFRDDLFKGFDLHEFDVQQVRGSK